MESSSFFGWEPTTDSAQVERPKGRLLALLRGSAERRQMLRDLPLRPNGRVGVPPQCSVADIMARD